MSSNSAVIDPVFTSAQVAQAIDRYYRVDLENSDEKSVRITRHE